MKKYLICLFVLIGFINCCDEGPAAHSTLPHSSNEVLTPDYLHGPWFPMEANEPFEPWTQRKNISNAILLLQQISVALHNATETVIAIRKEKEPEEIQLISQGKETAEQMKKDLDFLQTKEDAYKEIPLLQQAIAEKTANIIAPNLERLSQYYKTESVVRFPFAERLAAFTEQLQEVLRAKEDAACKLKDYLSAEKLQNTLSQYNDIAAKIQEKIDSEIKAASEILNPNSKKIFDLNTLIDQTQSQIQNFQANLTEMMKVGGDYVSYEEEVKQIVYDNQIAFVNSMETVQTIQNNLINDFKDVEAEELRLVHHLASLLTGLMTGDVKEQSALEPPKAVQHANVDFEDCDQLLNVTESN